MNLPFRRLACPGLDAPMETGDGFLARLVPTGRTIPLDAAAELCAAVRAYGNGIIEITARRSIQVRGLRPDTISAFAATIRALEIASEGVPVAIDPLAGLSPNAVMDASALAVELRCALAQAAFAAQLGPKVSVVIDGGGTLHHDTLAADVRLRPDEGDPTRVQLMLGGTASQAISIGTVPMAQATEMTLRMLEVIAKRGRTARARDLIRDHGLEIFKQALGHPEAATPSPPRPPAEPIGRHRLNDGHLAVGIGIAFGHTDADALEALIAAAERSHARGLRTAQRALLVLGLTVLTAPLFAADAADLGFIVRADDPRRHIATCAGAPICRSAQFQSRALAPMLATAAASLLDGSFTLHLSGCAKGCAHHAASAITLVGDRGRCDLVIDGTAGSNPMGSVTVDALPARLVALADVVARTRGEHNVADALTRLGRARVVEILSEAGHG